MRHDKGASNPSGVGDSLSREALILRGEKQAYERLARGDGFPDSSYQPPEDWRRWMRDIRGGDEEGAEGWPSSMSQKERDLVAKIGLLKVVDDALHDLDLGGGEVSDAEAETLSRQLQALRESTRAEVAATTQDASLLHWSESLGHLAEGGSRLTQDEGMPNFLHGPVKDAKVTAPPKRSKSLDQKELAAALPSGVSVNQSGYSDRY